MPGPFDYSTAPPAAQSGGILEQWSTALQDPATRAALTQMGLQMMQPMSFGQSPGGHLAQAVGAGGEAATRVEEADLKEDLTAAKLAQSEESTAIARARLGIGQQNADTRRAALAARQTGGGLSAAQLFRAQQSRTRQMELDARQEARDIQKRIADAKFINPGGVPDATDAKWAGKSTSEIMASLLSDPTWAAKYKQAGAAAAEATVPPPAERKIDQVYNTPKGPLVWRGNGWAPPTAAPPGEYTR